MKIFNPDTVLQPMGGYSQGIEAGGLIFVAGQCGVDVNGKLTGDGGMAAQVRQAIANVEAILAVANATLADVVSTTVYVKNFSEYKLFDQVWQECFGVHKPTRATVQAEMVMPLLLVEIQAIAVHPKPN